MSADVEDILRRLPKSVRRDVEPLVRACDYDGLVRYIAKVFRVPEDYVRALIEGKG